MTEIEKGKERWKRLNPRVSKKQLGQRARRLLYGRKVFIRRV